MSSLLSTTSIPPLSSPFFREFFKDSTEETLAQVNNNAQLVCDENDPGIIRLVQIDGSSLYFQVDKDLIGKVSKVFERTSCLLDRSELPDEVVELLQKIKIDMEETSVQKVVEIFRDFAGSALYQTKQNPSFRNYFEIRSENWNLPHYVLNFKKDPSR